MSWEELDAQVRSLSDRLRIVEDVEEIENLQIMYGPYLDYGMWEEFVDLFSDNAESFEVADSGVYLGKAGVERLCKFWAAGRVAKEGNTRGELRGLVVPRIMFHAIMIGQAVIDISLGGKSAYGRWGGLEWAARSMDGTWIQYWGRGVYENEYIKEDGRWRFKKLHWYRTFLTLYEDGWLKAQLTYSTQRSTLKPDRPGTGFHPYPEVCSVPFHYRHPITGR